MTLTVTIDTGACALHVDCESVAPEVFSIDDVAVVVGTGPDELMLAAAQACPSVAIALTDADGRRVYPARTAAAGAARRNARSMKRPLPGSAMTSPSR